MSDFELPNDIDLDDPEALDAFLDDDYEEPQAEEPEQDSAQGDEQDVETTNEDDANSGDKNDGSSPKPAEDEPVEPDGVLTADGKNFIPFSAVKDLRETVKDLRKQNAELSESATKVSQLEEALKEHGIDITTVGGRKDATKEKIQQAAEESPVIAELISEINERQEAINRANQEKIIAEVNSVIAQIPELNEWHKATEGEGVERLEVAKFHDAKLEKNPAWQNRPLKERFEEAVRLTNIEFEPQTKQASVESALKAAFQQQRPNSLSDIGATPKVKLSLKERLEGADINTLTDEVFGLSDAELDELLG